MTIITINEQGFSDVSEWLTYVDKAYNIHVRAGWEFVDTLRDGIDQFGGKNRHAVAELYELASQQIGLSIGTLQNYISIARAFPVGKRVGELGIAHHMAVRGLPDGLQESLLDNAVSNGLSAESLRYEARKHMPNFANIDISETSNNTHCTNGTNGHIAPADEYEQQADELAGDESGYDWTEDEEQPEELTFFDGSPISKPHVSHNSGNNEWYTPSEYIEAARSVLGDIDLDPASCQLANETVKAKDYYTVADDGLSLPWYGRVWMNPPYAKGSIDKFSEKLANHFSAGDVQEAIVLVNNATETAWFQDMISVASAVAFPQSRVKFYRPDGTTGDPLQGQAIIYMGNQPDLFRQTFSTFGWSAKL